MASNNALKFPTPKPYNIKYLLDTLEYENCKSFANVFPMISTYTMVHALNDFEKYGWSILHWFCKDLKQISILVKINQNMKLFNL